MSPRTYIGWIIGALAALAVCVGAVIIGISHFPASRIDAAQAVEATRDGDLIVTAALMFKAERGRYPTNINELVPEYLTNVPQSRSGFGTWRVVPEPSDRKRPDILDSLTVNLAIDHTQHRSDWDRIGAVLRPGGTSVEWAATPNRWYHDMKRLRTISLEGLSAPAGR